MTRRVVKSNVPVGIRLATDKCATCRRPVNYTVWTRRELNGWEHEGIQAPHLAVASSATLRRWCSE